MNKDILAWNKSLQVTVMDAGDPTIKEGSWIQKLKCYAALRLNIMEI